MGLRAYPPPTISFEPFNESFKSIKFVINDFNVALILVHDQQEEEESPLGEDGAIGNGIAFGSAINLTYTDPVSGYGHKVSGVASGSIGKVNTVATASIGKINTVD